MLAVAMIEINILSWTCFKICHVRGTTIEEKQMFVMNGLGLRLPLKMLINFSPSPSRL